MADHIWVVRLPDRRVAGAGLDTYSATQEAHRHGISQWVLDGLMYDAENGAHTSNNGYTLTREPLSATVAVNAETFTAWLCEQMPQGTVIGDPKWWAPKILHAVRAFTEVPAPVAASEPVAEHVAWLRYVDWPNGQTSIRVCDSDDEGAFKVYTHPPTAAVTVTEACSECNGTGSVVVPVCCGSGYGSECCGCPDREDAPCPKCAPHPSAAGVSEDMVPVRLGAPAFSFDSFAQWVNKAQSWFWAHDLNSHNSLCLDALNRPCISGAEFQRADKEGAFPVRVYALTAACSQQTPSAAGVKLSDLDHIRWWINAYTDPASGPHFHGHGIIVALLREYLALRESLSLTAAREVQP